MPLHRYIAPSYFGGMPGTHDLINVISGGTGTGDGSALVNPIKPGPHPNAGTYFVAFGEDATSGNANRGLKALAENTDFLDDIVHADQSIPNVTAVVVPGAPVASAVIAGNVFVGSPGEVNDQRTRSGLVAVLDGDGYPLHIATGGIFLPVVVSKIHDGLGNSVLDDGYFANPTVDFTPSIPAGQSYRLVHYLRGNLKTQPPRTYTRLASGFRGTEDLWAYAKTTREGITTFTGVKTFQDDVFFGPGADVQFEQDVTLLATASLVAQGPISLQGATTVGGAAVFNNTAEFNNPVVFDGTTTFNALAEFTVDALFDQDVDIVGQLDVQDDITTLLSFRGMGDDATIPILFTTQRAEDNPGQPTNAWKLLQEYATGGLAGDVKVRLYSGNFNTFSGIFALTTNAAWNGLGGAGGLWTADDPAIAGYRLSWDGTRSHIVHKQVTAVPWDDGSWDLQGSTSLGAFNISGEYGYSGGKPRQVLNTLVGHGDWSMANGLLVSLAGGQIQFIQLEVPSGCTITRVEVLISAGAGFNVKVHKVANPDFITPGPPTVSLLMDETTVGAGTQVVDSGVLNETVTRATEFFTLEVTSQAALNAVTAVRVSFTQSSLRSD